MLGNNPICAILPTQDLDRARNFYVDKLGLQESGESMPGGLLLEAGAGSKLYIYERGPSHAEHTQAGFNVDNIESIVDEMTTAGVKFEHYDSSPIKTNEKGIAELDGVKSAWFKDPDGNILAINQMA